MTKVKVYFDLVCPYCYLGRGFWLEMQKERPVEADWVPWELNPDMAPEGRPLSHIRLAAGNSALQHLSSGLREFSSEPNPVSANSHNALLGLEFARLHGKAEDYIDRIFRANYAERVNISGIDEVTRLGAEVGLDAAALRASVAARAYEETIAQHDRDAEAMGLEVVPSFTSGGKLLLAGSTQMDFAEFREKYLAVWG